MLLLLLAVTGMMLSHLFSLLYIIPFCLAQLCLVVRRRNESDLLVWMCVACALLYSLYLYINGTRLRGPGIPSRFPGEYFQGFGLLLRKLEERRPALLISLFLRLAAAWGVMKFAEARPVEDQPG